MPLRFVHFALLAVFTLVLAPRPVLAANGASDWIMSQNSRVRLVAALMQGAGGAPVVGGIEIGLEPGWKTYWRTPGDAGGVPPEFDWSKSANVASATVLFPAPERLTSPEGDSIGYKHAVVFPVAIVPADAGKPVSLDVKLLYGVCKNICIPEEHELTLSLDPAGPADAGVNEELARALASVPAAPTAQIKDQPRVASLRVEAKDGKPSLVIDTEFPAGTSDPQLFVEALDSSYVPLPGKPAWGTANHVQFRIDLSKSDDLKQPSGKRLRLTLVGDDAASEAAATIP